MKLTQRIARWLAGWTILLTLALLVSPVSWAQDGWPDLVLRNQTTGNNTVWFLVGREYSTAVSLPAETNLNWEIVGAGDFNQDSHLDLMWRNATSGDNRIWFLNGASYNSTAAVVGVADVSWKIRAVADYNGDGKPDLLWRQNSSGANVMWYMNGAAKAGQTYIRGEPLPSMNIVAGGSFDPLTNSWQDILWRDAGNGQNVVWYMSVPLQEHH